MKCVLIFLSLCIFSMVLGSASFGQEIDLLDYEPKEKEPMLGVVAAWLLPSLGHAYAQAWWPRGAIFLGLDIAAFFIALQSNSIIGAVPLIGFRVWECIDAYLAVEKYNQKLAQKYGIQLSIYQNKPYVYLHYRF